MNTKNYTNLEISRELKELGFNGECDAWWIYGETDYEEDGSIVVLLSNDYSLSDGLVDKMWYQTEFDEQYFNIDTQIVNMFVETEEYKDLVKKRESKQEYLYNKHYPAYTAQDILDVLPEYIKLDDDNNHKNLMIYYVSGVINVAYTSDMRYYPEIVFGGDTLADALGLMLIELIKKGIVKI